MNWEEAKIDYAKWWNQGLIKTGDKKPEVKTLQEVMNNLIQAAEEEIANRDSRIVVLEQDRRVNEAMLRARDKAIKQQHQISANAIDALNEEITQLQKTLDYAVQLVPDYHDPALQQAAKRLSDMWLAIKDKS